MTAAHVKVYWFDDGIAMIDCICGKSREWIIHDNPYTGELDRCESCGRRYHVVQYVEVIEEIIEPGT